MTKLSEFISTERERFDDEGNNRFAIGFSQISRYQLFLSLVLERYEEVSQRFIENQKASQALLLPGTHTMTVEHMALHETGVRLIAMLHLEIETFYLFAKIYLDKISRALEFYFGQGRGNSLDSHDQLVKNFVAYADEKGLSIPANFMDFAVLLKRDVSDFRDYQISHEKNSRRLNATMFDNEGNVWMAGTSLYPEKKDQQVESKVLKQMMQDLDLYIDSVISLLRANINKTRLKRKTEQ
jgi:hypothetical protein